MLSIVIGKPGTENKHFARKLYNLKNLSFPLGSAAPFPFTYETTFKRICSSFSKEQSEET